MTSGTLSACSYSLEDALPSQACFAHVVPNQDRGGFFCHKIAVKNKLPAISFGIESGTPLSLKVWLLSNGRNHPGAGLWFQRDLVYRCCGIFDDTVNPEFAFVLSSGGRDSN